MFYIISMRIDLLEKHRKLAKSIITQSELEIHLDLNSFHSNNESHKTDK